MTVDEELRLSYYRQIGVLSASHGVFLVQHLETKRLFVKKVLSVYNRDVYSYLIRHPAANMPRIYEAVEDDGKLITIEEYISGDTLEKTVRESGPLETVRALDLLCQLCVTVNALHRAEPAIIHRDIKPSNIIITDGGTAKLLDMNAAKRFDSSESEDTEFIGTVGYAAPEQYGFGASTVQTDIYALGVVLNYALTGHVPKDGAADGRLGEIVKRCTEIDPANRYSDVYELYKALREEKERICYEKQSGPVPYRADRGEGRFVRWLPPGFRTLRPLRMLLSGIAYAFLFTLGIAGKVEGSPPGMEWVDKLLFVSFVIICVFFLGNYMDVWSVFRLDRIKNPVLRFVCVLLVLFLILTLFMFITNLLESVAGYSPAAA